MSESVWCFCPGYGPWHASAVQRGQRDAEAFATDCGWHIQLAPGLADITPTACWHPLEHRLNDMRAGWNHDWWWPMRGGYGCIHLIPWLLEQGGPAPKLIGYSDITVLHAVWQQQQWGTSYHAWMPEVGGGNRARASLRTLVRGETVSIDQQQEADVTVLIPGSADGPVFTGCLSVLVGLVGTPAMPDLKGRILCLEDIDERPYRVDRHLSQLYLSGSLTGIAALILGTFPEENPPNRGPTMMSIIEKWAQILNVPCLFGLGFGHVDDPWSLPCGGSGQVAITSASEWSLSFSAQ